MCCGPPWCASGQGKEEMKFGSFGGKYPRREHIYFCFLETFYNLVQIHLTGRTDKVSLLLKKMTVLTELIFQLSEFSFLDMLFLLQAVKAGWCNGNRRAKNFSPLFLGSPKLVVKQKFCPSGEGILWVVLSILCNCYYGTRYK